MQPWQRFWCALRPNSTCPYRICMSPNLKRSEVQTDSEFETEWEPTAPMAPVFQNFRAMHGMHRMHRTACPRRQIVRGVLLKIWLAVIPSSHVDCPRCCNRTLQMLPRLQEGIPSMGRGVDKRQQLNCPKRWEFLMGSRTIHPPMAPRLLGIES